MTKRRIAFGIGVGAILIALFIWNFMRGTGSNSQQTASSNTGGASNQISQQTTRDLSGDNDTLVVYFSRTRGVYNGPLQIGNTKRVADFIAEATGGDQYEILPAVDYPEDYQETTEVARREQDNDERPAIQGDLPDLSGYENVFIGAPVWWSEYPMIVRTFIDAEKDALAGKRVIPFTTHEGSGLGNTQRLLESELTSSTVLDGFFVRGNSAADSQSDVNSWLTRIGVTN